METAHNHNAKSQLAKLLASENIRVQHSPSAKTAWFDVQNRILMLPVWREMTNDLYDMLVVHEVGHALDTPRDGWLEAIKEIANRAHNGSASNRAMAAVKGFLNVIEDARIDKRQKRRFPGSRRNYVKGYQELIERDFFGTAKRDVNSMTFIDRLNIYFKGGAMLGIKFTAEERKMLLKVEAAETFDEVLKLTEEIYRWSKEHKEDEPPQNQSSDSEDIEGEGDDGDYDFSDEEYDDEDSDDESFSPGSDESEDEDEEDEEDSESGEDKSDDSEDSDKEDEDALNDGTQDSSENEDDVPESETEKAWEEKQKELVLQSDATYIYARIPKVVNYNRMVIDYKQVLAEQRKELPRFDSHWLKTVRSELMEFKAKENATLSFMVKEFEMRKSADEYLRTSTGKTGVIDTNKLHSYKYNDDLFRRMTTVATGKNHGFVMFIDWSGSMEYNLQKTIKQLFSLAMFCKRVQIPFEVYSFRTAHYRDLAINGGTLAEGETFFTRQKDELMFDNFFARNILSSRMKIQELNEAMFHLYILASGGHMTCDNMGSTPLIECIGVADQIVNRFRAKSKVQVVNTIFLTDGESDPVGGVHGYDGISLYGKKAKYILQDDVTKKNYDLSTGVYNGFVTRDLQTTLLKVLKERTGCNLIGFFICGDSFDGAFGKYNSRFDHKLYAQDKESWRTNGFFAVTNAGYDEYYMINSKNFDVSNTKLNVDKEMTKNRAAKEFIKFTEKKAVSRVLLSRFVKRIAA